MIFPFRFLILKTLRCLSFNIGQLILNPLFHSGIGLETTVLFLREGASVLMADISVPALETATSKIKGIIPSHTGRLEHIRCDVSKETDVAAMVSHVDSWGGVVSPNVSCASFTLWW